MRSVATLLRTTGFSSNTLESISKKNHSSAPSANVGSRRIGRGRVILKLYMKWGRRHSPATSVTRPFTVEPISTNIRHGTSLGQMLTFLWQNKRRGRVKWTRAMTGKDDNQKRDDLLILKWMKKMVNKLLETYHSWYFVRPVPWCLKLYSRLASYYLW